MKYFDRPIHRIIALELVLFDYFNKAQYTYGSSLFLSVEKKGEKLKKT